MRWHYLLNLISRIFEPTSGSCHGILDGGIYLCTNGINEHRDAPSELRCEFILRWRPVPPWITRVASLHCRQTKTKIADRPSKRTLNVRQLCRDGRLIYSCLLICWYPTQGRSDSQYSTSIGGVSD